MYCNVIQIVLDEPYRMIPLLVTHDVVANPKVKNVPADA
jgi:hypothetical protein